MSKLRYWFLCGRYDGSLGGFAPPAGIPSMLLYWLGQVIGRHVWRQKPKRCERCGSQGMELYCSRYGCDRLPA